MPASPPERRLQRVQHIALFDALSLLLVAVPAALVALVAREWLVVAVATGIALCGGLELAGRHRLQQRSASGPGWLCAAQLCCLGFILVYSWHLAHQPLDRRLLAMLPSFTREQLAELFPDPESLEVLLAGIQRLTAAIIALVAILYQGGLAFYYLRTRTATRAVFAQPPVLRAEPPPLPYPSRPRQTGLLLRLRRLGRRERRLVESHPLAGKGV